MACINAADEMASEVLWNSFDSPNATSPNNDELIVDFPCHRELLADGVNVSQRVPGIVHIFGILPRDLLKDGSNQAYRWWPVIGYHSPEVVHDIEKCGLRGVAFYHFSVVHEWLIQVLVKYIEHSLLSTRRLRECKELFKYIIIKTLITTHLCALVSS